jgi:cytochrome c-type biogenesis protein
MSQYFEAFVLGNGAILGNVCMLPLYPGMVAFLAGTSREGRAGRGTGWLGALVLAGILSMMLVVALILFVLQQSFGALLPVLLPAIYLAVIVLGGLMLAGRNPFAQLAVARSPALRSPFATAYLYGLLLGPMTLPCTGPLLVSAFLLGAGSIASLADGLLYFLVFGLGFGWPLVLLPLLARSAQRRLTGWLAGRHTLLERASGLLLIGIGLFGLWAEVLPNV